IRHVKALEHALFLLVIALIAVEIAYVNDSPASAKVISPEEIPLLDFLKNDTAEFRTINLGMKDLIGAEGYNYNAQLGIETLKGGGGIWTDHYARYMSLAEQYLPFKLYGILNAKYVISDYEINDTFLRFAGKFEACSVNCGVREAWGPYLYQNSLYLPRYYIVNNSALVAGSEEDANNVAHSLLLTKFNPSNSLIVHGKEVGKYPQEELERFNLLILTSMNPEDADKVIQYKSSGNTVLPDLFNKKNSASFEEFNDAFGSMAGQLKVKDPKEYSSTRIVFDIFPEDMKYKNNFLVLSEQFAVFPGWHASLNGKPVNIYRADGMISGIYLNEPGLLEITYRPGSFITGVAVSSGILILILIYFGIIARYRIRIVHKKDEPQNKS
ncbi:hypothetical protein HYT54_04120, partial [Candidatus Woesearchaeota archaeon]|nr:hypothetical protein [Candidatus Woesearchaeota archaeon]